MQCLRFFFANSLDVENLRQIAVGDVFVPEGEVLTVDGSSGAVLLGDRRSGAIRELPEVQKLRQWAAQLSVDPGGTAETLGVARGDGTEALASNRSRSSPHETEPLARAASPSSAPSTWTLPARLAWGVPPLSFSESNVPDPPPPGRDYTKFLNPNGLTGARIGIPRALFYDSTAAGRPGRNPRGGLGPAQRKVMDSAIAVLKAKGAVIVDPADIPSVIDTVPANNFLNWNPCGGLDQAKGRDADCSIAFKYGMKRDFNLWLKSLGDRAPVKTLTALREWNIAHQRAGAIKYGQANLDVSDEMDLQADRSRYEADRRN